jgi:Na+/proline symporter/signal transduction histidine kinase
MNFQLDIALIMAFLLINLALGLYHGRGVKTIKDYALGGRNFSTGTLVSTIIATWIGGDYLFITMSEVYTTGLLYAIGCLGMAFQLVVVAYVFVPRMTNFLGSLSIAEAMGDLFGKEVRMISALSGVFASAGFIAVQFKVFGSAFSFFLDMPHQYGIFLASAVTIVYSAFGGIRSITITDVLQFFTFGVMLPVIGIIVWNDVNTVDLISTTSNPLFNYKEFLGLSNPKFWDLLMLFMLFVLPGFEPAVFQRISMGRSVEQVQKAFYFASPLLLFILAGMAWIGFLLFNIDQNLEPDNLVHYIVNNYAYDGLKSFIIIGIIAMCMSTADSEINASTVLLTHDLLAPLKIGLKNELVMSKIVAVMVGCWSIFLAMSSENMLKLVFMTQSFYAPIVGIPFMLTVLGFRTKTPAVLIGMGAGFAMVIFWREYLMDTGVESIIPGMVANLVFLVGSHYFLGFEGGWSKREKKELRSGEVRADSFKGNFLSNLTQFNFISFCKNNAPKNELSYTGFGVFSTISTICTMYSVSNVVGIENNKSLLMLYEIMLFISISFATYPIWPATIKAYNVAQISWNISIFLLLVFFNSFFVILTNFSPLQFVVFSINLITTAILTRWKVSLSMFALGIYLSIQYYKYYVGTDTIDLNFGSTAFILYSLLLIGTALIIFLKPQQEYIEATENKVDTLETEVTSLGHEVDDLNLQVTHYSERVADQAKEIERLGASAQKILNNVNHELRLPIGNVMNFSDMLYETLQKTDNNLVKELVKEVYDNAGRVSTMVLNMLDLATLDVKKVDLNKKTINFSELVEDRVKNCRKIYLRDKKIDFKLIIEPEILVYVDPNYIRQTVDNLVINSINFSQEGVITISVTKKNDMVVFTITDQGIGIPKAELADIFTPFKMGSNTESKAEGRGVGLALCKSAVEAHGGIIKATSHGEVGASLQFELPL